mmetsp:Transcript_12201/g.15953  ORF Transcript_12201/g.15953 Transcript_12201/m.15953 type:complete len:146 (-) Transcript_12201:689-1126(-)
MRRNFVQIAEFLQENFPELRGKIQGSNYPTPPFIEFLANMVSGVQMVGLAWMVMGANTLFRFIPGITQPPAWALQMEQQYSIQMGILLFLIMPQFIQRYTTTGAFEIYLNGDTATPIFSKLAKGRFPQAEELLIALGEAGLKRAS